MLLSCWFLFIYFSFPCALLFKFRFVFIHFRSTEWNFCMKYRCCGDRITSLNNIEFKTKCIWANVCFLRTWMGHTSAFTFAVVERKVKVPPQHSHRAFYTLILHAFVKALRIAQNNLLCVCHGAALFILLLFWLFYFLNFISHF